MQNMVKTTILGVGLVIGTAFAVQAQSVSTLPPSGSSAASAPTQPYVSTVKISPDPGGSVNIKDEHYQPPAKAASRLVDHPYSDAIDSKTGLKPN